MAVTKPRKTHALSIRERDFVKYKLAGLNNAEAAKKAGYSPDNAYQTGSLLMRRDVVREALGLSLNQLGITFEAITKPITDGLVAMKTIVIGHSKNSKTIEVPDLHTRLAAAKFAWTLLQYEDEHTTPSVVDSDIDQLSARPVKNEPDSETAKRKTELLQRIEAMDEVELTNALFDTEAGKTPVSK